MTPGARDTDTPTTRSQWELGDTETLGTQHSTGPAPVGPDPDSRRQPRPGRSLRRLRWVLVSLLAVVLTLALGFGILLWATPSTADAPHRVETLAATEHARRLSGPLPARVVAALLATEDSRFYSDSGIDLRGAVRGTVGSLFSSGDHGGATLDQQLVKLLYTGGRRGLTDRIEQVALAVKLDAHFSKAEILRLYLDTVYFGHGFYGVTAAAQGYFGRAPGQLTWAQASTLAGLVQAPSTYDPLVHPSAAKARQRHVLDRLVATGKLTRQQADLVARQPL